MRPNIAKVTPGFDILPPKDPVPAAADGGDGRCTGDRARERTSGKVRRS